MISKIEARTPSGLLLTLPLDDYSNGFIVKGIDGLDPVKAVLVSSSFAATDGSQYQSSRRESRYLILKIKFAPDYSATTVRELRNTLYKYFMTKSQVYLRFYIDDSLVVNISGRVETFEAPLFVREPEASIYITCFDPDFVETDSVEVSGSSVDDSTTFEIDYTGSVDTGVLFELDIDRTLADFTIYHQTPDGQLKTMDFSGSFQIGDTLKVSSIFGEKYVILNRDGVDSYALYTKSPQSGWLELQNGSNVLRVYAIGTGIPFTITYFNRHGGL